MEVIGRDAQRALVGEPKRELASRAKAAWTGDARRGARKDQPMAVLPFRSQRRDWAAEWYGPLTSGVECGVGSVVLGNLAFDLTCPSIGEKR